MSSVTGGVVRFLQRVNTGNYEHKEAEVTFNFSAPDEQDWKAVFDQAVELSRSTVLQQLGLVQRAPLAPAQVQAAAQVDPPAPSPRGKAKKPPTVEAAEQKPAISTGEARVDQNNPADFGTDTTVASQTDETQSSQSASTSTTATEQSASATTTTDVYDFSAPEVVEITAKQLQDACNLKVNASTDKAATANAIRKIIGDLLKPGAQLSTMPAELRQTFLDKLADA